MRNTHICPKCSTRRIWVIEKFRLPSETEDGRVMPVVPHQHDGKRSVFASMRMAPQGAFDLYMCDACGFSELWARDIRDLKVDEARGIRLVDNSDLGDGPFR